MLSSFRPSRRPPELALIALRHLAWMRADGTISEQALKSKIARLRNEDMEPCNFDLLIQKLDGGKLRFIIKDQSNGGEICDSIEC